MKPEEFITYYDSLADALFRHCYFRVFDRERAKDVVQETFCRTWDYLSKGNKVDNVRAFLYRVATNLIIDESRKKKTLSLDELQEQGFEVRDDSHHTIYHSLEVRHDMEKVREALKQLDPKFREVLVLRYINDFGPKEISEITGETENVVSVRLHRATKRLRTLLS